jgi:hypothetical protein
VLQITVGSAREQRRGERGRQVSGPRCAALMKGDRPKYYARTTFAAFAFV